MSSARGIFILAAALLATGPAFAESACPAGEDAVAKAGGYVAAVE